MSSQIAQSAGAGGCGELAPGCRGVRVCAVRAVELAAEGDKVAQLAGVHQFLCQHVRRALGVDEVHEALDARLLNRLHHGLAFRQRVGHRLLAQDVLAGLGRRDGDFRVGEVRGCDDNQINFGVVDDIVPVGGNLLVAETLGCKLLQPASFTSATCSNTGSTS